VSAQPTAKVMLLQMLLLVLPLVLLRDQEGGLRVASGVGLRRRRCEGVRVPAIILRGHRLESELAGAT
jgi:hypothetical protein